jgi:FlaA1/EpsC-like NDP-sugar epimerase
MHIIDIPQFIKTHITKRDKSLFENDINQYQDQLTANIKGKSVLVIGGAGTIGSSYIKAILNFEPARLYVVDTNENGLTELTRDLRSKHGQYIPEDYKTYPMNFGDEVFRKMFVNEGPFHIVANFAAHKHVRSEKDHYSIEAMIDNNVFKAKEFLDLLVTYKPEHFFCVSTDKAANPVNVMGASKNSWKKSSWLIAVISKSPQQDLPMLLLVMAVFWMDIYSDYSKSNLFHVLQM